MAIRRPISVPTANELTGDFTGAAGSGATAGIYDPLTTCGYNGSQPDTVRCGPTDTETIRL